MLGTAKTRSRTAVSLDTNHANGFVTAGVEKCWSRFDHAVRCTTFSSSSAKARMANTSRGRSTPPAKTTRAKHTRKTTPTSPSWRFTNETIPARHIRGGDVTPTSGSPGRRLDGHMARFAFEALGIELTEGQPDTSANKANEKKSRTMKKVLAAAGLGAAITVGSLVGAGTASADHFGDPRHGLRISPVGLSGPDPAAHHLRHPALRGRPLGPNQDHLDPGSLRGQLAPTAAAIRAATRRATTSTRRSTARRPTRSTMTTCCPMSRGGYRPGQPISNEASSDRRPDRPRRRPRLPGGRRGQHPPPRATRCSSRCLPMAASPRANGPDYGLIQTGHMVCIDLRTVSRSTAKCRRYSSSARSGGGVLSPGDAGYLIGASQTAYCPWAYTPAPQPQLDYAV